ncbi:hypothetical protein Tco_0353031 [Tanacetum coccineum]
MSADSVVTYTSVHSEARSWSIPSEDLYEEAARQLLEQAPRSPEYVPDPIEMEDHVPVYIPESEHPEDLVPAEDEAPTPPLPLFFLSPRTPPLLPIPLLAPSTSRRADIPEADTPPRKRLLLTTPRPSCEVGESSTAAARQPGPTMTHRVDYSLVDTMETRFRDTKRRMMTALEMVNMRVSYQVDVRSRESSEFYSRHHDAQKDRAAVRAEIEVLRRERLAYEQESMETRQALARSEAYCRALEARVTVLETEVRRHEWQRQAADDLAVQHIMRTQALEAGARVDTLEDTAEAQEASRASKAPEGVVDLTRWFEKMEFVFNISNFTAASQVKFATCTLQDDALTWWNSHVKTATPEIAHAMPMFPEEIDKIKKFIGGLPDMIHGSVKASKPKTMQKAIEFTTELMDEKSYAYAKRQAERKRKYDDLSKNNQNQQQQNKRQNTGQAYTADNVTVNIRWVETLSSKCNYNREGPCPPRAPAKVYVVGIAGQTQTTSVAELGSFDSIIDMDWLAKYQAVIMEWTRLNIISCTKTQKYMEKGFSYLLAHVTAKEVEDKSEKKRLEDVPIVQDFPEVFPEDFPGPFIKIDMWEFQIDLVPGAAPVARAPYRLASFRNERVI